GIKHGLLDFYNDNDGTSEAITTGVSSILQENGLGINNVSSYVADDASVKFGKHSRGVAQLEREHSRD
ncbi:unnamed protein product, partial [Caretta caretta]